MENYFFLSTGRLYFLDNAVHTLEETNTVYSSVKLVNFKAKLVLSFLKLKRNAPRHPPPPKKTQNLAVFWKIDKIRVKQQIVEHVL